jgi:hypothetical protein
VTRLDNWRDMKTGRFPFHSIQKLKMCVSHERTHVRCEMLRFRVQESGTHIPGYKLLKRFGLCVM